MKTRRLLFRVSSRLARRLLSGSLAVLAPALLPGLTSLHAPPAQPAIAKSAGGPGSVQAEGGNLATATGRTAARRAVLDDWQRLLAL